MHSYDHRIQRFGTDSYLLTWRSDRRSARDTDEPCNAATMDRTSAEKVCALYNLDLPYEPLTKQQRSARGRGWFGLR